jgi:hypothetical protein
VNQPLGGPGLGLPLAQNLYPSELPNVAYDLPTNSVSLAPGENLLIPAGDFLVSMGGYLVFQYKDPLTGVWTLASGAGYDRGYQFITSDGQNVRVANLTGCPVLAVITSTGATYVQGSTTITVTGGGGSLWAPIIGGALAFAGGSVASTGAGYGIAPMVLIPQPQPFFNNANGVGGIAASGYVGLGTGTVVNTGVTFTNPGAGYQAAPAPFALLPTPTDPNLATGITLATASFTLTSASLLMGVLCTNNGAPLAAINGITLAVNGVGVTASATACCLQTVVSASVSGAGIGYGTVNTPVFAVGGVPPTGTIGNNPDGLLLRWQPRQVAIGITGGNTSVSVATAAVVYDGGLFFAPPTPAWPAELGAATTVGTVLFTMGSRPDIAVIQPAT